MSSNSTGSNTRRGRGGRRGGRGRGHNATSNPTARPVPAGTKGTPDSDKIVPKADTISGDSDDGICWICAEPVKFYALSECNHRTCHVCALRLRALYKRTDCTFCKHAQVSVIFTISATKVYPDFTPNDIPFSDPKLQISFETKEMMEDTMILLRFNCPDPDCDVIAQGWTDLKWHAKDKHDSILCDLCIRHKKIFAHEHTLYSPVTFGLHMPSVHTRRLNTQEKATAGLPDMVHPMCQFCRECLFGDDELFGHLREHHEECFVCKRDGVRDQYFRNYEQLEQHFKDKHYPCIHPTCLEQKFVVFSTQLDLQGHQVGAHGEQMSSRDRRDARRIDVAFGSGNRGGRGRGGGRGGHAQVSERTEDRAREPPPQAATQPPPQPAPPPSRGSRRAAFGASLTVEGSGAQNVASTPQQEPPRPTRTPDPNVDPEILEQHNQFLSLLNLYASTNGAIAIRGAIRSYKASESSAKDMLATIRIVVDDNMNVMSSLVNGLVPLFDEEKRKDILNAWNGMKIEQRDQFPSLTPTSLGSGFADIASGRVLNVKYSTRSSGSRAGSSSRSAGALWDRVERVAAGLGGPTPPALQSSAAPKPIKPGAFPPLGGSSNSRSGASFTPWSSTAATQTSQHIVITPARAPEHTKGNAGRPPPIASSSAFPELPSSSASRVAIPKMGGNQSLKRIAGESPAPTNVWGGGDDDTLVFEEPAPATNVGGKGKKKKGKETLFTLGSFPN
ncbi:unnamed protein product [Rhizoctonia solani]|uniref:RING-type E3 ubiquitin transferase n=1 Tax=Rhizoctonia solani TaxID=456999 RepID=A0A8H3D659_9AGAM|nr:unnamed protein product [Rhizoctonia solani]